MSAFNTATLLLFPGLGLVALAMGLLSRRYSVSACAVGLTGLLTLTTASTWISSAGSMMPAVGLDKLRSENEKLMSDLDRLNAELRDERKLGTTRAAELEETKAEVERLKDKLGDEHSRATGANARAAGLGEKLSEAERGKAAADSKLTLLEDELRRVKRPPAPPDLEAVRDKLAQGDQRFYATRAERELIPGRRGTWYVVRLLQDGREWSFPDRLFVLSDPAKIKTSMAHLRDDVLDPLSKAGKHWRLFVRGAADARRVAGPVARELSYLPPLPDGTHASEPRVKRVIVSVQNEDLPTLRADWLRQIARQALGAIVSRDIHILENPPRQEHGRTAELVLVVEW